MCGSAVARRRVRRTTPSTRNIITEGIHDKRVGQPGGFGCGEGPDAVCDVTFTVTAIEEDPPCPGVAPPAGIPLKLLSSQTFETGVLYLVYAPPDAPAPAGYDEAEAHLPQNAL